MEKPIQRRDASQVSTAVIRKMPGLPPPTAEQTLSMPPLIVACKAPWTENGALSLIRPLSQDQRDDLTARVATIERSLSTAVTEPQIIAAIRSMKNLGRRLGDDAGADALVAEWVDVITDEANGITPHWAVERTAKAFRAGIVGDGWFPKVGTFLTECKRVVGLARGAWLEMTNYLDAPVVPARTDEERAAMLDKIKYHVGVFERSHVAATAAELSRDERRKFATRGASPESPEETNEAEYKSAAE